MGTTRPSSGARPSPSFAVDPEPLLADRQWIFDLRYEKGDIVLVGVASKTLPKPRATPRVIGRFALELFDKDTIIERVRFDFPLLGGEPEFDGGFFGPAQFAGGLTSRVGVTFPVTGRGDRLELVDGQRGTRYPLPWPPNR